MSDQEITKQAFADAEKEAKEKKIARVKNIVTKTLEKLESIKDDIKKHQEEIKDLKESEKILEMDLTDLKEGKLDRIIERQEKDPKAKDVSVVILIKELNMYEQKNPWFYPYHVITREIPIHTSALPYLTPSIVYCDGEFSTSNNNLIDNGVINCSVSKDAAIGTYEIHGNVIHFR